MANEKRLTDTETVIRKLRRANCAECDNYNAIRCRACWVDDVVSLLEDSPTVDAVEVVHGEWRYYSSTMQECSNCQRHTARHKFKYCPHCGAVMEDRYYE